MPQNPYSTHELAAWDRQFLWHPFTPMKPWCENKDIIVIDHGDREWLIDTQGRRYIDGVSSLWCNVHGHCVPELDEALRDQLSKIAHSTLLGLANVPSILLAKRLVELMHARNLPLQKVFYSDDGSTAVEVACKMAYQYWKNRGIPGKTKFLAMGNAYHGDTLGAVSLGGIPIFHAAFKELCFPVDLIAPPQTTGHATPADNATQLAAFLTRAETLLQAHASSYAAIVIEPLVQGAGGMIMHPPGILKALRTLADRHHVLLIFDEVMTGFGRTGKMFACEHEHVSPDLLCLSKGLTAGYMPLGVTMTTPQIYDAFYADPRQGKTFFHGHTFTGHPLACAVALASLDLFDKNNLLAHAQRLGHIMGELLEPLRGRPYIRDVRRRGLIAAVDLADNPTPTGPAPAFPDHWRIGGALCTKMRDLHVMLRPLADTIVLMPPLAISEKNLRHLCSAVVKSADWLPHIVAQKRQEFGA